MDVTQTLPNEIRISDANGRVFLQKVVWFLTGSPSFVLSAKKLGMIV